MSGISFNYKNGSIQVEFSHGDWDYIGINIHLYGDTVITTSCDEHWSKGESIQHNTDNLDIHMWTSSTLSHFFLSMVHWLEAIICKVDECAFNWEAEGPDGELRWFNQGENKGLLHLYWTGTHHNPEINHKIRLNTTQMISVFYEALRNFVASDDYNPFAYENMNNSDAFSLILNDITLDTLTDLLIQQDARSASAILEMLSELSHQYSEIKDKSQRVTTLEYLQSQATKYLTKQIFEPKDEDDCWLELNWDQQSEAERRSILTKLYQYSGASCWNGENLRELCSPMIEQYLKDYPSFS